MNSGFKESNTCWGEAPGRFWLSLVLTCFVGRMGAAALTLFSWVWFQPPHSPKQKLSIECHDHTAQMLRMPVLEAELSVKQLLDVVEPGVPPSGRAWKDQLWSGLDLPGEAATASVIHQRWGNPASLVQSLPSPH
jgi:hypothetical protein